VLDDRCRVDELAEMLAGKAASPTTRKQARELLVAAGEAGGILDIIFRRLATYMEKAASLRRQVMQATIYPSAILVVGIGVMIVMMTTKLRMMGWCDADDVAADLHRLSCSCRHEAFDGAHLRALPVSRPSLTPQPCRGLGSVSAQLCRIRIRIRDHRGQVQAASAERRARQSGRSIRADRTAHSKRSAVARVSAESTSEFSVLTGSFGRSR
jgi:hypothetical protein